MSRLLNESWIAGLPDNIVDNLEALNRYVVLRISERIKEIGDTGASNSRRLMSAIQYAGADLDAIEKEVARIMEMNQREVQRLFEEVAAENIGFANTYYAARGMEKLSSYRNRASLIAFVESAKRVAMDGTANLSHTHMIGFKRGKQIVPLREYYISAIDRAVTFVQTGTVDYNTAMRSTVREMAQSGLRRVTFDSGYSRRLDSQARMNILEGVRRLNAGMMAETGKEFGADGVEISVHGLCAPDHQPIQGRQYPDREYEVLNNSLRRRIGTLNCGHTALPVILGVNRPQYSREELEQFRADNEKGVEIDGVHYTGYEAAQMQRRLERSIRAQKRRVMVDEAAGDTEKLAQDKSKLNILHQRYQEFSKTAGLKTQYERTEVAGVGEKRKKTTASLLAAPQGHLVQEGEVFNPETAVDSLLKRLENSPGMADNIAVIRYYAGHIELQQEPKLDGPIAYNPHLDMIRYNPGLSLPEGLDLDGILVHEIAHQADRWYYNTVHNSAWTSAIEEAEHAILAESELVQSWFAPGGKYAENPFFSDIISAISRGEIYLPYSHRKSYWAKPGNREREIFANMVALDVLVGIDAMPKETGLKDIYTVFKAIINGGIA